VSAEPADRPDPETLDNLFGENTTAIHRYVDLLISVGVDRGLLGPREAGRIWQRHVLNCAVIGPAFARGAQVADLGSGAGLPGVVLAIARPDLRLVLLEPLQRRTAFLHEVVDELELDNVQVLRTRAEEIAGELRFDAVTARAVAPLATLAGWAFPLLCPGGELVAIKGRTAAEEIERSRATLGRLRAGGLRVGRVRLESFGMGVVEPATQVVRIESQE